MWNAADGMIEGHFKVTPEVGGQLKAVFDAEVQTTFRKRRKTKDREPHEAYAADVFTNKMLSAGAGTGSAVKHNVHIVFDHAVLVKGGVGTGDTCEIPGVGPVDFEWVRDLLGSAFLTAVIKKGKDITTVAHLGRHVPAEIMTALLVGGRECDVDGCDCPRLSGADHSEIDYAKRVGRQRYWNLGWLCYAHHKRKGQGWKLGPRDPVTGKRKLHPPPQREQAA